MGMNTSLLHPFCRFHSLLAIPQHTKARTRYSPVDITDPTIYLLESFIKFGFFSMCVFFFFVQCTATWFSSRRNDSTVVKQGGSGTWQWTCSRPCFLAAWRHGWIRQRTLARLPCYRHTWSRTHGRLVQACIRSIRRGGVECTRVRG